MVVVVVVVDLGRDITRCDNELQIVTEPEVANKPGCAAGISLAVGEGVNERYVSLSRSSTKRSNNILCFLCTYMVKALSRGSHGDCQTRRQCAVHTRPASEAENHVFNCCSFAVINEPSGTQNASERASTLYGIRRAHKSHLRTSPSTPPAHHTCTSSFTRPVECDNM